MRKRGAGGPAFWIIAAAGLIAGGAPALAHGSIQPTTAVWTAWELDPYVIVPLILAHWLYGRGVFRLWQRAGRAPAALSPFHMAMFLAGEMVLVIALLSPLEAIAGRLLSAHMAQHLLLMTLAPLLLLAGRPQIAFAWGLPRSWIEALALDSGWRVPRRIFQTAVRPFPAALLHGLALWAWHAPAAYEAALRSEALHALEHAMFLGTALLFWQSVVGFGSGRVVTATAAAMLATLITIIHSGFLGALLTFSPRPIYETYMTTVPLFGLSPLEDQQLAGILMWVPAGVVYLLAVIILAWRLIGEDSAAEKRVSLPG